ncbi:hypothetical protein B7P43_G16585 [Cryptotermes secundus]|uniref:Uncharacterized protein n=1 Tax=Cryptotermes secundus TaxID=105785 RepID=A0A2J7RJ13_9NEOP|nr:hypothetical protein B7P43_G16585 [Cryptotermes secundus]
MIVLNYREVQGCDNLKKQTLQDKNNLISVMYLWDIWKERQRGIKDKGPTAVILNSGHFH